MRQPYGAEYSIERLRVSGAVFVAGRIASAALNIYIFYLVASRLPIPTYALYVWLLAFGRLLRQLSEIGINAIALNYVPYIHSQFGGDVWRRFLLALVAARLGVILLAIGLTLALASAIVGVFGEHSWLGPLRWYALVLVIEHALEFIRQCVLAPLIRQVALQLNQIVQAAVTVVALGLGLTMLTDEPTIYWVIGAQACGSGVALAIVTAQLWSLVRSQPERGAGGSPPSWRELMRFGLENFSHDLLNVSSGPQLMTLLGSRLLGVAELATFGFIQNLYVRIERLVPGRFFMVLIRPSLIVRYHADASFTELNRRIVLVLKASLCMWAALVPILIVSGDSILGLLSSDKYRDGYGLLIGFIAVLAIQDLKRVVVVATNTLRRSVLLRRAGFLYLIAVPIAFGLVAAGAGFYGLLFGMIAAELAVVVSVVRQLRAEGLRLDFDGSRQLRIVGAAAVAGLTGVAALSVLPDGLGSALVSGALTLPVYALMLWRLRPLRADERRAVERLLNRRLGWL